MEQRKETNNVNHPSHYNQGKYEVIDVIEDWKLNFNLGNAIKYIARCPFKRNKLEDLEKAKWYIEREIKSIEKDTCKHDKEVEEMTDEDLISLLLERGALKKIREEN